MGKCLSLSFNVLSFSHQGNVCGVQERTYEDVERFIRAAMRNPVIGRRFKKFTDSRVSDLSERISVMLNYAFKYNTVTPFADVLRLHTTLGITEEEVDVFHKLLLKVCYSNQAE